MLKHQIKPFKALTIDELYNLVQLRIAVFIIEQNCIYQELDGKDKNSYHLLSKDKTGKIIGTLRILPAGLSYKEVSIGRVVLKKELRGKQNGHQIMAQAMAFILDTFGKVPVRLSAQKHLEHFYAKHAFKSTGKEYLEDGIPHVEMLFTPNI